MRKARIGAAILTVMLSLACFKSTVMAQEESQDQQDHRQEQQRVDKKSASQGERATTRVETISNSLSSYRLEFTLTEFNDTGKKVNSRTYSVVSQVGPRNKLRIGGRVPVASGTSPGTLTFQYLDIGMNIDCSVQEQDGFVLLNSTLEASSAAPQRDEQTHQPVIRQMRSEVRSVLMPGKPTMISSMDDPTSQERFQLDVTATKLK